MKKLFASLALLGCAAQAETFAVVTAMDFPRIQLPNTEGPNYTQIQVFGADTPTYHLYIRLSDGSARWQSADRNDWRMIPFGIWLPDGLSVIGVDIYDSAVNPIAEG